MYVIRELVVKGSVFSYYCSGLFDIQFNNALLIFLLKLPVIHITFRMHFVFLPYIYIPFELHACIGVLRP